MYAGWVILDGEGDGWDGFMFGIEAAIPIELAIPLGQD